jgi:hypothetical protein
VAGEPSFSESDHEVDVARLAARERRRHAFEQTRGTQVDVLVELAAELEQRAKRDVIRHGRGPADRTEQDRIDAIELCLPVVRHHLAVLCVVIATGPLDVLIREADAIALADDIERAQRFGHYFLADAVAGNHCDVVVAGHMGLFVQNVRE